MSVIKRHLPSSQIHFSTNGDFLTKDILDSLILKGLSRLTITCHQNTFSTKNAEKRIGQMLKKLRVEKAPIAVKENYSVAKVEYKGGGTIPLRIFSSNFLINGQNRANSLKDIVILPASYRRNKECWRPTSQIAIAYDGSVYPCCMFFHGIADRKYIVGNCAGDSLFDLYADNVYAHFKNMGALKIPFESPCTECTD